MGCHVKLLFLRKMYCLCSLPNFVLHVTSHVYTYLSAGQVAAFGKGGVLHLCFRKTGQHIAASTLQQMCHLFYLKGACKRQNGAAADREATLSSTHTYTLYNKEMVDNPGVYTPLFFFFYIPMHNKNTRIYLFIKKTHKKGTF